jgi:outer membrane biogenesis lipoprotein LolB
MRRNRVRFVLALVATTILSACADLSTGPQAPTGPRSQAEQDSTISADSVNTRATNSQGSQV